MRRRSKYMYVLLAAAVLCLVAAPAWAADGSSPLVSTEWLQNHLKDPGIVIIDVRTEANYKFAHIPGAVSVAFEGLEPMSEEEECQLMIPPDAMTRVLQEAGVNRSSHVVIYDHGNTASDASKGAAALWILRVAGHTKVSYLDGGLTKWTFEGRVVDATVPTPPRGDFVAGRDVSRVATLDDVVAAVNAKNTVFVDTRSAVQHFGVEKRADAERYGHIPGSVSLPAGLLTDAGINRAPATIKDKGELAALATGLGVPQDKNTKLIVYCNSAQQAGLGYLVLSEILGYRNVKVYDGSMLQYAASEDLPLVRFAWGSVAR